MRVRATSLTPEEPSTPEGRLIRAYREGKEPAPTIGEVAGRLGWSSDKLGKIERGHTRTRNGKPPREHHAGDADLVRVAAVLGIPAEDLDRAGRTEAADLLRARSDAGPEHGDGADDELTSLLVRLVEAFLRDRADQNILRYFWDGQHDADGQQRPREDCVRMMIGWIVRERERPAQPGSETG